MLYGTAVLFGLRDGYPPAGKVPTEPELKVIVDDLAVYMRKRAVDEHIADHVVCGCGRQFPDLKDLKVCPYCGDEIEEEAADATTAAPPVLAVVKPVKEPKPKKEKPVETTVVETKSNGHSSDSAAIGPAITTPAVELERVWEFIRAQNRDGAAAFWHVGCALMDVKRRGLMSADPEWATIKTFEKLIELRTGWTKAHAYRAMQFANSVTLEQIAQHTDVGIVGWGLIAAEIVRLPEGERASAVDEVAAEVRKVPKGKRGAAAVADVKRAARKVAVGRGAKAKAAPTPDAEASNKAKRNAVLSMLPDRERIEEKRFDLTGTINSRYELPYLSPKNGAALSRPRDLAGMFVELRLPGGNLLMIRLGKSLAEISICRRTGK